MDLTHDECEDIRRILRDGWSEDPGAPAWGGSSKTSDERLKRLVVEPMLEVLARVGERRMRAGRGPRIEGRQHGKPLRKTSAR